MKRNSALQTIMETVGQCDPVVSTTGLISREVYERFDDNRCFYVPGSMGLVSSIGFGIALNAPECSVVIIDGDASLLMNLGTLVTIGAQKPANLTHIVLDNRAYGSCSEEQSLSLYADLSELARAAGYQTVVRVTTEDQLRRAILEASNVLTFIHVIIDLGGRRDFRRPQNLREIKKRFMRHIARE